MQSPPIQEAVSGAARARKPRFQVRVKGVRHLSARMIRVTFAAEGLAEFAWSGPASHVKLIFDAAQGQRPDSGAPRPVMRTYTPRRFDRASREIDIDFLIHGEGPASTWAEQAAAGQSLVIAGPGRSYAVDAQADWFLLAGDETAIPAISTILECLPPSMRALVLIEVADAGDERALGTGSASAEVCWIRRDAKEREPGRALETAVRELQLPSGAGRIYVACEADAMRRIRRHLLTERQIFRDRLVTRGYWRRGQTDYPDRDYGEDVA